MHFRSSGLDVWENWARTKTQFCIPFHSSCLPLESSQRRQRHPIATPLKDTKGRTPTTEQFFCILCVDFECQSEKGGDPTSGPPPSLPAGEQRRPASLMPLLAPQSGALRISAYRDFHPIPNPILPLIAFEHLSLSIVIRNNASRPRQINVE